MHSHTSAVHQGMLSYVKQIGDTKCKRIHNTQTYTGFPASVIGNIKSNTTTSASITLAGKVGIDGTCQGTVYVENGITWTDVAATATVKISIQNYWATTRLEPGEIILRRGVTCPYMEGYCMDTELLWT